MAEESCDLAERGGVVGLQTFLKDMELPDLNDMLFLFLIFGRRGGEREELESRENSMIQKHCE